LPRAPARTLAEWERYIERQHPRTIELGLDRVCEVAGRMGLAALPFAAVSVAGTNGKGSCVGMLEAALAAAGYRTGAYTSPHLVRYNERVRVDCEPASDALLCEAFAHVDAARGAVPLTYFEFGTLAAVEAFRMRGVEIAVLEVGMGGRLDAVNAWDTECALVTSIGLDHCHWLGPDREAIGREKAGIFRAGRPAICADPDPPASVLDAARAAGAPLLLIGRDFRAEAQAGGWRYLGPGDTVRSGLPRPAMRARVQLLNAAAVVTVLECLRDRFPVSAAHLRAGMAAVVPGRFQTLPGLPVRVIDVAHNAEAAGELASSLGTQGVRGHTRAVFGALADKPVEAMVRALAPQVAHWHLCTLAVDRGLDADSLQARVVAAGVDPGALSRHPDPVAAYREALAHTRENDRVLVFGSFHTAGDIMRFEGVAL